MKMKSLTPPILPKVPALRSAASQSCELRLQFFWTSEKEVEIFNNGWGVQNKQRDPLFTSRIPSPASSSLPIPIFGSFYSNPLNFCLVCLVGIFLLFHISYRWLLSVALYFHSVSHKLSVNFLSCLFHFASVLYTEITITFTFSQQGWSGFFLRYIL